jgi:hypothetical protein
LYAGVAGAQGSDRRNGEKKKHLKKLDEAQFGIEKCKNDINFA